MWTTIRASRIQPRESVGALQKVVVSLHIGGGHTLSQGNMGMTVILNSTDGWSEAEITPSRRA